MKKMSRTLCLVSVKEEVGSDREAFWQMNEHIERFSGWQRIREKRERNHEKKRKKKEKEREETIRFSIFFLMMSNTRRSHLEAWSINFNLQEGNLEDEQRRLMTSSVPFWSLIFSYLISSLLNIPQFHLSPSSSRIDDCVLWPSLKCKKGTCDDQCRKKMRQSHLHCYCLNTALCYQWLPSLNRVCFLCFLSISIVTMNDGNPSKYWKIV